jgi:hypothetical protein
MGVAGSWPPRACKRTHGRRRAFLPRAASVRVGHRVRHRMVLSSHRDGRTCVQRETTGHIMWGRCIFAATVLLGIAGSDGRKPGAHRAQAQDLVGEAVLELPAGSGQNSETRGVIHMAPPSPPHPDISGREDILVIT